MKILIVCSANSGQISPFIQEQGEALVRSGMELAYFKIQGKGFIGYLKNLKKIKKRIKFFQPDIIHAHYGLSGLLSNLQRTIPVVTTYLGSDINNNKVFPFSKISMFLSAHNIFVSEKIMKKSNLKSNQSLIPFGVVTDLFIPIEKEEARKSLGFELSKKMVLFAGAFQNRVKNATLAKDAVSKLPEIELLKMGAGYTREQVVLLMNAVDVALMTSLSEGSPQFIKEALACNCPVVSVPVGDVPEIISNIDGCFIATYNSNDIADKLQQALIFGNRTDGRKRIIKLGLDANTVGKKVIEVYKNILCKKNKLINL